ncbi:MAG: NAD-dependent epimerase/dehydratase family protein [Rickettsiales bacterium]|nr:NAD-dependent epimerase/dehydratase family protein [Rickettsiales bacterium]
MAHALVAHGHEVIVLDNLSSGTKAKLLPQARFIVGNILEQEKLAEATHGIDGCFHLATVGTGLATTIRHWRETA